MTFELPETAYTTAALTATELRELEQGAPKTTPKELRGVLLKAASQLEQQEARASDAIRILEEALALRISQMDSPSRAQEVERAIKNAMNQALARLRG